MQTRNFIPLCETMLEIRCVLKVLSCACLALCLLVSGCNPKSEEQTEEEPSQSEAKEEEKNSSTESEKTVKSESETLPVDQEKPAEPAGNSVNTEPSASATPSANHTAKSASSNKNGNPRENSATIEASAAYSSATGLRNRAAAYSKKGDSKSAYQSTLAAWEAVRHVKSDKKCQELSGELLQDMEKYDDGLKSPTIHNVLKKPVRYE